MPNGRDAHVDRYLTIYALLQTGTEKLRRVDPHRQMRPCANHAPH